MKGTYVKAGGILAVLFLLGLGINSLAKTPPPGLDEVLAGSKNSFDLGFLFLGLCALSLATFSVAKTYELLSRKKTAAPEESGEEEILSEENQKLTNLNLRLQHENEDIKRRLSRTDNANKGLQAVEETLKKNISSLQKEYEKMAEQNTKLMQESVKAKPVVKASRKKAKTTKRKVKK